MSGVWRSTQGSVRIEIDTVAMSKALASAGRGPVDAIADQGMMIAKSRDSRSAKFISMKRTIEGPKSLYQLKSQRINSSLSRMLSIPVALITNNSAWAAITEFGLPGEAPKRPLSTAFEFLSSKVSKAVRGGPVNYL